MVRIRIDRIRAIIEKHSFCLLSFILLITSNALSGQTTKPEVTINPDIRYQSIEGFGASLAYYENWLTAHPNKSQIYQAIFGELSLDILRVRNAYDYDPGMIDRVKEFADAAASALDKPIKILSTSWGPPGYLKNTNNRKNGGTLGYTLTEDGIEFDYEGFANWWKGSLDEYNTNGVYPTYISIQNEPDWSASWETCLLTPSEKITSTDTVAGYNEALEAVYTMVEERAIKPKILGPETVGVGYNSVQNYINALNISYLYGIAHHLYHGVDEDNPWISTDIPKVGDFYPEIPHFQTEFSRGDWFSLVGLVYKSLHDENVVSYLYWNLIWDQTGLVGLDFPWDKSRWKDVTKGYTKNKEFFAFKQFSAFIHPGWERLEAHTAGNDIKLLAFMNTAKDSASVVLINRSQNETFPVKINIPGFSIDSSAIYRTSENDNCEYIGELINKELTLPPYSVSTAQMLISETITNHQKNTSEIKTKVYPNPFTNAANIHFSTLSGEDIILRIYDSQGRLLRNETIKKSGTGQNKFSIERNELSSGLYFYIIQNSRGLTETGNFVVKN